MECNKDEAIRAMQVAEKKMVDNDFEGARRIALKAKSLYPELTNIAQLLSICDVHCSAKNKVIGAETDWYGILQVEKLSDESTAKKQYRRLALSLHPDKNKFPGAEAAFKLVSEAHAVLSDPTKKASFDSKIRSITRYSSVNPPSYQMNRSFQKHGRPNHFTNGFGTMNHHHQGAKPSTTPELGFFWTICPFCSTNYQYSRVYINQNLQCVKCFKSFAGYETHYRGANMAYGQAPPHSQPAVPKPGFNLFTASNVGTKQQCSTGTSVRNDEDSMSSSRWRSQFKPVNLKEGARGTKQAARTAEGSGGSKSKQRNRAVDNLGREGGKSNANAVNEEAVGMGKKPKKNGRKRVVESSESSGTSSGSDVEEVATKEKVSYRANNSFRRRSTRSRKHVSYQERDDDDDDDDDFDADDGENQDSKLKSKREPSVQQPNESVPEKDSELDKEADASEESSDLDADSAEDCADKPDDLVFECMDPEFHDFDKDRNEGCFAADKIWACYDETSAMPRYYAKVKKVHVSPFQVTIVWLEPDPIDEAHVQWNKAGLPIACGTFKLGKTAIKSKCHVFSHQVHFDEGQKRNSFIIRPKAGEIWALFRDWDINWSSSPKRVEEFKYEIVEVLLDFNPISGTSVCYMDKVEGSVSVFQKSRSNELQRFVIGPDELLRFSHCVPNFKVPLSEKSVPAGSVELDPASLPLNPEDLWYPGKAEME